MKKFAYLVIILAISLACLIGCNPVEADTGTNDISNIYLASCSHQWRNATCTEPTTCTLCGETAGDPIGHQWVEATYESPKTCIICGETEGRKADRRCPICNVKVQLQEKIYCNTHACMRGGCLEVAKHVGSSWGQCCIYHSCQEYDCLAVPPAGSAYCSGRGHGE